MSYDRRIIVDLDDTLSFTTNRDWANARPNTALIHKLNSLYVSGWEIWIVTARGQLSCDGDFEKADAKYREIVEDWLAKHGVKYHVLSFQKRLATIYVDDKAMRPDEMVNAMIRDLPSGLSGTKVTRIGNSVFKTEKRSREVRDWYTENFVYTTPEIKSLVGETIEIAYVEGDRLSISNGDSIEWLIDEVIDCKCYNSEANDFSLYVNRLRKHTDTAYGINKVAVDKLYDAMNSTNFRTYMKSMASFCHGDLSLDNIIVNRSNECVVFDPIPMEDSYSSFMLDVSKLIQSCERHGEYGILEKVKTLYLERVVEDNIVFRSSQEMYRHDTALRVLILSHWIRILSYAASKDNELYNRAINKINMECNVLRLMICESFENQ